MIKHVKEILKELIGFQFYEGVSGVRLREYLKKSFVGCHVEEIRNPRTRQSHLVIAIDCKLKNLESAIILSGHMDTIVPQPAWDVLPIEKDGKIFGLGAVDMRGFIACLVALKQELLMIPKPIIIVLSSDEESTAFGMPELYEFIGKRNIKAKAIIVGEPRGCKASVYHNGFIVKKVVVTGRSSHIGLPHLAINAVSIASELIQFIQKDVAIVITPVQISSNGGDATIPDVCEIKFSVSYPDALVLKSEWDKIALYIEGKIKQVNGLEIEVSDYAHFPLFKDCQSAQLLGKLEQVGIELFDKKEGSLTCTEASFFSQICKDTIIFGPGDRALCHKQGEYIEISQLEEYIPKLLHLLKIL